MLNFFDDYPLFYKPLIKEVEIDEPFAYRKARLNKRYLRLIHPHNFIKNSRILDIACQNGKWSFAALKKGAIHVTGIEARKAAVDRANFNMDFYKIETNKYNFICGDVHDEIIRLTEGEFDAIFLFGFFYHTLEHEFLLKQIKRLSPKFLILDTSIAVRPDAVIVLKNDISKFYVNAFSAKETKLVGIPSRTALEMMLADLGFSYRYINWFPIKNELGVKDYASKRRVTVLIWLNK